MHQAGYRKGHGCVLQLFSLFLLLDNTRYTGKELFLGLLDFEKAFDYTNRPLLVKDMMKDGIGKKFVQAIVNVYENVSYSPKLSNNSLGEPISSSHGVTQGKKTSANLFSFFISDMCRGFDGIDKIDSMDN